MSRHVLLTGASGRIGRAFRAYIGDKYHLRLADKTRNESDDYGVYEFVEADCADLETCRRLCDGINTVVHLAADPSPRADFYGSLLDNNIKAVYNIFQAAKEQGCRRVIFPSSIQTIEGYPLDVQAKPELPTKPMNMYAVGKIFGEATAHYFAYAEGLSSIAIRVGAFEHNRPPAEREAMKSGQGDRPDGRQLSSFVSARDLSHLIERCIEVEGVQYAIVHGISDNRFKRMDITSTREVVGYEPQDDAFEMFHVNIDNRGRWLEEYNRGKRTQS